ncbi:DUF418 domain-containing protein [Plantactinospora mayteni]|uniref:DUF418 domain-containing protein n=1 Tax=Plantactinospora mayteni TaxID=566021 RepID=A0ABQ4ER26_9ACTN|nr:hypothetical protein Pma05_36380 [Plantactinospora mayteni]
MAERIVNLDVLRGFALLGILIVNITVFQGEPPPGDESAGLVKDILTFAFSDKFYTLFALLFGYGLAIQMRRAGTEHVPRMRRRLAFLLVIGLLHAVFLFFGDVLASYAIAGAVLLAMRNLSPRTVARAAVCAVIGLAALHWVLALGWALAGGAGDPAASDGGEAVAAAAAAMEAYQGSFTDIVGQRLSDLAGFAPLTLGLLLPNYIALFLAGMAAGAYGLLDRSDLPVRRLRQALVIGLAVGLPGAALSTVFPISEANPVSVAIRGISMLTVPALTIAYGAGLLLLLRTRAGRRLSGVLAPAGRMALSNYLGQSVLCAFLFTGYGLALIGTVGSLATAGIAIAIFAVQVVASRWWLRRFRFGPMEWLLRSVTYWRRQTLRPAQVIPPSA